MEQNPTDRPIFTPKPGPDIDDAHTQDEYEQMIIDNAKYFTVLEIRPGAWRRGESNFVKTQHTTYDEAIAEAKRRYEAEPHPKRGNLIYAIADFPRSGARDMTALVEAYPPIHGPFTRQGHMEKQKNKGKRRKALDAKPTYTAEPSDRYFEGDAYLGVTNVVKPGGSKVAIKFKNKRR